MMIHISQTSQSYLVPEKKMIIFLKHAGVRGWFSGHEYSMAPVWLSRSQRRGDTHGDSHTQGSAARQRFVA